MSVNNIKIKVMEAYNTCDAYEEVMNEICEYLTETAPSDNKWYHNNHFFCVDVVKSEYDEYMSFIENIIGCSYCYTLNDKGLTLKVSLSTLYHKRCI